MNRLYVNLLVNLASLIVFLGLAGTGFILRYLLPFCGAGQGYRGGRGPAQVQTVFSLCRSEWLDVHFWLSMVFAAIILLHVLLHYRWLKCCLGSLFAKQKRPTC